MPTRVAQYGDPDRDHPQSNIRAINLKIERGNKNEVAEAYFELSKILQRRKRWPIIGSLYDSKIGECIAKSIAVDHPVPERRFAWAEFLHEKNDTRGALEALKRAIADNRKYQQAIRKNKPMLVEANRLFQEYSWVILAKMGEWCHEGGDFAEAEANSSRVVREIARSKEAISKQAVVIYQYCVIDYSRLLFHTQRFGQLSAFLKGAPTSKVEIQSAEFLAKVDALQSASTFFSGIPGPDQAFTELRLFIADRYRDLKLLTSIDELRSLRIRIMAEYYTLQIDQLIGASVNQAADRRRIKHAKESEKLHDIKKRLRELLERKDDEFKNTKVESGVDQQSFRDIDAMISETGVQSLRGLVRMMGVSDYMNESLTRLLKKDSRLRVPWRLRLQFLWIRIWQHSLKIILGVVILGAITSTIISLLKIEALVWTLIISILAWFVTSWYIDPRIDKIQVKNYKDALSELLIFVGTDARLRLSRMTTRLSDDEAEEFEGA